MFKKTMMKVGTLAVLASGMAMAVPAEARNKYKQRGYNQSRYYDNGYNRQGYQNRNSYRNNYRNNYRCDKGNGGLAIGAVVGGLAGNEIAGRGDRTLGTILGAGVGAIAGRAIDRSNDPCRR